MESIDPEVALGDRGLRRAYFVSFVALVLVGSSTALGAGGGAEHASVPSARHALAPTGARWVDGEGMPGDTSGVSPLAAAFSGRTGPSFQFPVRSPQTEGSNPQPAAFVVEEQAVACSIPGCPPGCRHGSSATDRDTSYPTVKVSGFFQADAVWFSQSGNSFATVDDLQDGADFRRARLGAAGKVADNVSYGIEFDFGFPGRPSFMDLQMTVERLPVIGDVRVGQWRQPLGMDALTSVRELTFLERALPFAFVPFRQIGVGLLDVTDSDLTTWAISVVRFPTDVFGGNVGDDGGYSLITRGTALLLDDDAGGPTFHVGGGFAFIEPANNASRFFATPEIFVSEEPGALAPPGVPPFVPPFVDTGFMPTVDYQVFNVELAGVWGAWHGQAEWYTTTVNRIGGANVTFHGAYGQIAYLLTGERRPYNRSAGVLGRITPRRNFGHAGLGACELAFRLSTLDLDNRDIRGGRLTDITAGLNWYLNRNAKLQFNYIHAFLQDPVQGRSETGVVAMRAQVDF